MDIERWWNTCMCSKYLRITYLKPYRCWCYFWKVAGFNCTPGEFDSNEVANFFDNYVCLLINQLFIDCRRQRNLAVYVLTFTFWHLCSLKLTDLQSRLSPKETLLHIGLVFQSVAKCCRRVKRYIVLVSITDLLNY